MSIKKIDEMAPLVGSGGVVSLWADCGGASVHRCIHPHPSCLTTWLTDPAQWCMGPGFWPARTGGGLSSAESSSSASARSPVNVAMWSVVAFQPGLSSLVPGKAFVARCATPLQQWWWLVKSLPPPCSPPGWPGAPDALYRRRSAA